MGRYLILLITINSGSLNSISESENHHWLDLVLGGWGRKKEKEIWLFEKLRAPVTLWAGIRNCNSTRIAIFELLSTSNKSVGVGFCIFCADEYIKHNAMVQGPKV